jgi:HAMP domain-containing protein
MKDLMLSTSETGTTETIARMDVLEAYAFNQIEILYSRYLGPRSNVDQVKQEFIQWNAIRAETIRLLREGKTREAAARTQSGGVGGNQVEVLLKELGQIDTFAENKADELFTKSKLLNNTLNQQLVLLVGTILLLSLIIVFYLLGNIRLPLDELTRTMQAFKSGNLSSRSAYDRKNEFGVLSGSYNLLAETIQQDTELKEKTANLASLMLRFNDAVQFFQATLAALAENSGSQMAAVYLLSSDQKSFGRDHLGREHGVAGFGHRTIARNQDLLDALGDLHQDLGIFAAAGFTVAIQQVSQVGQRGGRRACGQAAKGLLAVLAAQFGCRQKQFGRQGVGCFHLQ